MEVRRNLIIGERAELIAKLDAIKDEANSAIEDLRAEAKQIDDSRPKSEDRDAATFVLEFADYKAKVDAIAKKRGQIDDRVVREKFALLAPHIRAWNLATEDEHGAMVRVPPPHDGGVAVMDELEPELIGWMEDKLLEGYRLGFPIGSQRSGVSLEPTKSPDAGETSSTSERHASQRSQRKSTSRSASRSTT
jgi:hypothetical protein